MSIPKVTQQLLQAKQSKGLNFADLEALLGRDEVWIAGLFYRQASASPEEAENWRRSWAWEQRWRWN